MTASTSPALPVHAVVRLSREYRLSVTDLGLACCAVEFSAALLRGLDGVAVVGDVPGSSAEPAAVSVLVVSGTITDVLAPAVVAAYEALPEPRAVVAFGACATSGGPYWDSYNVTNGADRLVPVDVYVPGCPPRPESVLGGLRELDAVLTARAASA